jgi:hypothetical protein
MSARHDVDHVIAVWPVAVTESAARYRYQSTGHRLFRTGSNTPSQTNRRRAAR